jgi:hypothetical protein
MRCLRIAGKTPKLTPLPLFGTIVALTDFSVAQPDHDDGHVAVYANDGWKTVITVIPIVHLQTATGVESLSPIKASEVVRESLAEVGRIVTAKYERGEFQQIPNSPSSPSYIFLRLDDLVAAGDLNSSIARNTHAHIHQRNDSRPTSRK